MTKAAKPKFRRRSQERPDELLDAALDLFIEQGFSATRVEDIATRAGLSKGAVYLYYPSKDAILEALVRRGIVPIVAAVEAMGEDSLPDPRQGIERIIGLIAGRIANPRLAAIPRIIIAEAGRYPHLAHMYRDEVIAKGLGTISRLIARGIESGAFRGVDPEVAVRSVAGPLVAHLLLGHIFELKSATAPEQFVRGHLDILFNGLNAPEKDDA